MAQVNIYEAKTHLSRLLRRVRAGEEIVIAEAGTPIARLLPIDAGRCPRKLGVDAGAVEIAPDFDAPLPDSILEAFYGAAPLRKPAKARPSAKRSRARRG